MKSLAVFVAVLGVCVLALAGVTIYTVWKSANRDEDKTQVVRPEFGTKPPDCWHLYDRDLNKEWSACMGVEYK